MVDGISIASQAGSLLSRAPLEFWIVVVAFFVFLRIRKGRR